MVSNTNGTERPVDKNTASVDLDESEGLVFSCATEFTDKHVEALNQVKVLVVLDCVRGGLTEVGLAKIESQTLQTIEMFGNHDTAWWRALATFPNLTRISCSSGGTKLSDLALVCTLGRLKELSFTAGPAINDSWVSTITACKGLEVLRVPESRITSTGMKEIAALKHLRELDVSGCPNLDTQAFEALAASISLRSLHVSGCSVIDSSCVAIARLKNLAELAIDCNEELTNTGATALVENPNLKDLSIGGKKLSGAFLAIASKSSLTRLVLRDCPEITDTDLDVLAKISTLAQVQILGKSSVTERGISRLRKLMPKADVFRG